MHFVIVTLFPELIKNYFQDGVMKRALEQELIVIDTVNPRDFVKNKYKTVDDKPFGGGDGVVLLAEPLVEALHSAQQLFIGKSTDSITDSADANLPKVIAFSPQGGLLNEEKVLHFAQTKKIILICGRYAGFDQRFLNTSVDEEISIGDFVLSGGEIPALALIEAVSRKIPKVLGDAKSAEEDSFSQSLYGLLEGPSFTRPEDFQGQMVPDILKSGHHQKIKGWRFKVSLLTTLLKREDLFFKSWARVKNEQQLTPQHLIEFFMQLKENNDLAILGISTDQVVSLEEKLRGLL